MALTIANRITIVRMLFIPVFILLIVYFDKSVARGTPENLMRWTATGIFFGIFLLDAIDGYVARCRNEISKLGTLLDPLADKAMLLSALILLSRPSDAFQSNIPTWFIVLAVSRDVLLVGGSLIIQSIAGALTVRPRISGKITTFFQMTMILWVLLGLNTKFFMPIVFIASGFTLLSGIQYVLDGIRQLERAPANGKQ